MLDERKPWRILLVEDHQEIRTRLQTLLNRQKSLVVVGEAVSGGEAEALAAQLLPDIVILDSQLPDRPETDTTGVAACRAIRAQAPHTRVLILTSYEDNAALSVVLGGAAG